MKIKGNYIMREIMDEIILIPVGETAIHFNGLISLDPVGAFIWKLLECNKTEDEILAAILEEFEVTEDIAQRDVEAFLIALMNQGLLGDDE